MRADCGGLGEDGVGALAGDGRAQAAISRWAPQGGEGEGGSRELQEQPGFVMEPQPELRVPRDPLPGALSQGGLSAAAAGTGRAGCGDLPSSQHIPAGDGHGRALVGPLG